MDVNGNPADGPDDAPPDYEPDDIPIVTCSRCDQEWNLEYELDELKVGNQAFEQFAMDHKRHTGHYPDDISPWIADCRKCPDGDEFLSERPARRWAEIHSRHTRHRVDVAHSSLDETVTIEP